MVGHSCNVYKLKFSKTLVLPHLFETSRNDCRKSRAVVSLQVRLMSFLVRGFHYDKPSGPRKSLKVKKAIFAVREIVHENNAMIYQSRGMACAVEVGGKKHWLTWHGVISENVQAKRIVMHRCSKKFLKNQEDYQLEISNSKKTGSCSFISVKDGDGANTKKFKTFNLKVPEREEMTNVVAHSFSGCKDIVKVTFKGSHKKDEYALELDSKEKSNFIFEKSAILGSPIISDKGHVIGVVGEDQRGLLCPYFLTKTELDGMHGTDYKEKDPTEDEDDEIKDKYRSWAQETPVAPGHGDRNPSENGNGEEKNNPDDIDSAGM